MEKLLIFTIRKQRTKSRRLAVAEALTLLKEFAPESLPGGPRGDQPGTFWVAVDDTLLDDAQRRFPELGLSYRVDTLEPIQESDWRRNQPELVRWRGDPYRVVTLYQEEDGLMERLSPNERNFLLDAPEGIRPVRGYRGPKGRRALQAYDAQLLVNLLGYCAGSTVLDPFAGAGNIAEACRRIGYSAITIDIDPVLRFGLQAISTQHTVASASNLPYPEVSFDGIVTEPPFVTEKLELVSTAFGECIRVLKRGCTMVWLVGQELHDHLPREVGKEVSLTLDLPLKRKGIPSYVMRWTKN